MRALRIVIAVIASPLAFTAVASGALAAPPGPGGDAPPAPAEELAPRPESGPRVGDAGGPAGENTTEVGTEAQLAAACERKDVEACQALSALRDRSIRAVACDHDHCVAASRGGAMWQIELEGVARHILRGPPAIGLAKAQGAGCLLAETGSPWCWREPGHPEALAALWMGVGETPSRLPLQLVEVGYMHFEPRTFVGERVQLSLGPRAGCAVGRDGGVLCWGHPSSRIGGWRDFGAEGSLEAQPISGLTSVVEVRVGESEACAREQQGAVSCWGAAWDRDARPGEPVRVELPRPAVSLAVGQRGACATLEDGSVRCWPHKRGARPKVRKDLPHARAIAGSAFDSFCVLPREGAVVCFEGQGAPWTVVGTEGLETLAVGGLDACGIRAEGRLVCWDMLDGIDRTHAREPELKVERTP